MNKYENLIIEKYQEVVKQNGVKDKSNWEIVGKWFEAEHQNIGLSVSIDNKNKEQPYTTERQLHFNLRVKSSTKGKYGLIEEAQGKIQEIQLAFYKEPAKSFESTALIDSESGNAFWDGKYCDCDDLDSSVVRIYYDKRAMKGVESLEQEMSLRCRKFNELGERFGITNHFYNEFFFVRNLYAKHNKHLHGCEHVSNEEAVYLDGSMKGGIMWAQVGKTFSNCFKYDINGMIPFILSRKEFRYPMTQGKITTIESIDSLDLDKPFICMLKLNGSHPWFVPTSNGYYTNYQIKTLQLLNIPFEVKKQADNAIIWNEFVDGSTFSFLEELYPLRKTNKFVKTISASIWGSLCKGAISERYTHQFTKEMFPFYISKDNNRGIIKLNFYGRPYKFATARLKTFLWSYARYRLINDYLLPLKNAGKEIYHINIDAFITNCDEDEVKQYVNYGKEFGQIKTEKIYTDEHIIENLRSIKRTS